MRRMEVTRPARESEEHKLYSRRPSANAATGPPQATGVIPEMNVTVLLASCTSKPPFVCPFGFGKGPRLAGSVASPRHRHQLVC